MTAQPPLADLLSQQRVLSAHIEKEARKLMKDKPTPVGTVDEELVERLKIQAEVLDAQGRRSDAAIARRSATLIEQLLNRVERQREALVRCRLIIAHLNRGDDGLLAEIDAALTGGHNG